MTSAEEPLYRQTASQGLTAAAGRTTPSPLAPSPPASVTASAPAARAASAARNLAASCTSAAAAAAAAAVIKSAAYADECSASSVSFVMTARSLRQLAGPPLGPRRRGPRRPPRRPLRAPRPPPPPPPLVPSPLVPPPPLRAPCRPPLAPAPPPCVVDGWIRGGITPTYTTLSAGSARSAPPPKFVENTSPYESDPRPLRENNPSRPPSRSATSLRRRPTHWRRLA